jgi:hypothetical protein
MPDAPTPRRAWLVVLALVGVGLIAAPVAFKMFDRAPKGATMIAAFRPYMTTGRLDGYQLELKQIDGGVDQSQTSLAAYLAGAPAATAQARFDARYPEFAGFAKQWPGIDSDMTGMIETIQDNLGNYRAVAALPSFTLFPWFFVAPGAILLVLLAAATVRPVWWRTIRWILVALGIGLIAAPAVYQMFSRAPEGERMVNAFKTIETRTRVETIQGYFGEMALGQGAVRLELVPALEHAGLTRAQIATRFPGVDTLDRRWIPIVNDFTPMIGTMSDNVVNYDAVAALPPFSLFPWFFVFPGLLVAALAFAARPRRRPLGAAVTPVSSSDPLQPEGAP